MKRYLIAVAVVAIIILVARQPVQKKIEQYRQGQSAIEQGTNALAQTEKAMSLVNVIQSQLTVSEKGFDNLQKRLKKEQAQISALKAQISDLKAQEYNHTTDTVFVYQGQPDTLDSALIIIDQQRVQIQNLQAINLNQALIIDKQDAVIELQDHYISQFETLRNQYRQRSIRNIGIAFWAGYIAGKLL